MNLVAIVGRLTKDPELKYLQNGTPVTRFTVAVQRNFKNQNGEYDADFINVTVWRKLAELVAQYTSKGSLVALEGRLQVSSYDNQEGRKVWTTEVVADNVRFLDSKKKEQQDDQGDPFQKIGKPIDLDAEMDLPF